LAAGYYGGRSEQARRLVEEGVDVSDEYTVNVTALLWWPQQ
jgi:alkylated DNA nucleotide flippase Atl1